MRQLNENIGTKKSKDIGVKTGKDTADRFQSLGNTSFMPTHEIEEIKDHFVKQLLPVQIYLFGSYATETYTDESDFDFYIVVSDGVSDLAAETTKAYKAIRKVKQHPVDIIVGRKSRFEQKKEIPSVENEVYRKGVLLYDEGDERMV